MAGVRATRGERKRERGENYKREGGEGREL